jgi:hypothetical protein
VLKKYPEDAPKITGMLIESISKLKDRASMEKVLNTDLNDFVS